MYHPDSKAVLPDTLSWLSDTKLKNTDNKHLCHWAQVILPLVKIDPMILEELLYESQNANDTEYVAALGPEAAEKLLNKLIQAKYQKNKLAQEMVAALQDQKVCHWLKKIWKSLCYNKSKCSILDRQIYFC